jgi:hypothetical protein
VVKKEGVSHLLPAIVSAVAVMPSLSPHLVFLEKREKCLSDIFLLTLGSW